MLSERMGFPNAPANGATELTADLPLTDFSLPLLYEAVNAPWISKAADATE